MEEGGKGQARDGGAGQHRARGGGCEPRVWVGGSGWDGVVYDTHACRR